MFSFYNNCVNWDSEDVYAQGGLNDLINDSVSIERKTFLKHVNREELKEMENNLSYAAHPSQGLTMAADFHVSYFKSKLHGKLVYGFVHSAIEHVFVSPAEDN